MIRDIAEDDPAQYVLFWNNFGKYLKVGVVEDDKNRKELAPLLRFFSKNSGEEYTNLDDYVENMPEGQKNIYYVTGDGKENAAMSPVVEKLASRGYDVLFATEPLDEIMMESLRSYKDVDIMDAAKENLKLDDDNDEEAKKKKAKLAEEFKAVSEYLETLLKGKVQKVVVSDLLTDSPAALVQGAYGMSPSMQRYMRAQAVATGQDDSAMGSMNQAVLEINPDHPIVKDLDRMVKIDKEAKELENSALLMYDVASMTSGYTVGDIKGFAQRVMGLMNDQAKVETGEAKEEEKEAEVETDGAEVVPEVVLENNEDDAMKSAD